MRVFLVDGSQAHRERLARSLTLIPELEIIGQTGNPVEATREIESVKPDVVILDSKLPADTGFQFLRELRERWSKPKVIVLAYERGRVIHELYRHCGANFLFDRDSEIDKFFHVLEELGQLIDPPSCHNAFPLGRTTA